MVGSGASGSAVGSAVANGYIIEAGERCQKAQGMRTIPFGGNHAGGWGVQGVWGPERV